MRLQLQMASTGTSSSSHGHHSEPEWCKPAWHDTSEWTREPRPDGSGDPSQTLGGDGRPPLSRASASVISDPCVPSADPATAPNQGGTTEDASVPRRMEALLFLRYQLSR